MWGPGSWVQKELGTEQTNELTSLLCPLNGWAIIKIIMVMTPVIIAPNTY